MLTNHVNPEGFEPRPRHLNNFAVDASSHAWAAREQVLQRFESAWRQGPPPAINDYLSVGGGEQSGLLVELLHIDLEFRLRAGDEVRVEEFLSRFPSLAEDSDAVRDLVVAEYRLRRRTEPDLTPGEYQRRFPQYGPELTELLAALPEDTCLEATVIQARPGPSAWPSDRPD